MLGLAAWTRAKTRPPVLPSPAWGPLRSGRLRPMPTSTQTPTQRSDHSPRDFQADGPRPRRLHPPARSVVEPNTPRSSCLDLEFDSRPARRIRYGFWSLPKPSHHPTRFRTSPPNVRNKSNNSSRLSRKFPGASNALSQLRIRVAGAVLRADGWHRGASVKDQADDPRRQP